MIRWIKQLNAAFGASFLWLICLVYFTQVRFDSHGFMRLQYFLVEIGDCDRFICCSTDVRCGCKCWKYCDCWRI